MRRSGGFAAVAVAPRSATTGSLAQLALLEMHSALSEDGLLTALCISSNASCASEPVADRGAAAATSNPPLRRADRLPNR